MYVQEYDDILQYQFDSLEDLTTELRARPLPRGYHFDNLVQSTDFLGRGIKDLNEAITMLSQDWPEGLKQYEEMFQRIKDEELPQPISIIRHRTWSDEEGDEIDLDRLKRGQPYWQSSHRTKRPGQPTITIISNIGARGLVNAEDILWRGAAAVVLSEYLERAGFRVELMIANYVSHPFPRHRDVRFLTAVTLKRPNETLDVSTFINAISGWFFRTIMFAVRHLPQPKYYVDTEMYGASQYNFESKVKDRLTPDKRIIYSEECFSFSVAVKWIKDELNKLETEQ